MRVDPDHQRLGYGRATYGELERRARDRGYEQLVLDVSVDNDDARAFYEAAGFAYVRTVELEALGRTFPLAVYRKELTDQ
jgi:ribosomal protein S18 acetylase RimI-like enzyme